MIGAYKLDKGAITFERHLIFRKQKKNFKRKVIVATLMLTSMVDMFSMLVCFLLQTFSSSPEILITKGVELPQSLTPSIVKEAPLVSIAQDGIYVDQKLVGKVGVVLKKPAMLTKPLRKIRQTWAKNNPGKSFPGEINLQAHKELSSAVVSQVMGILTSQHYGSIQLAVVSGGN